MLLPIHFYKLFNTEPISKRFSLVKLKASDNFNRRHPKCIPRIEI